MYLSSHLVSSVLVDLQVGQETGWQFTRSKGTTDTVCYCLAPRSHSLVCSAGTLAFPQCWAARLLLLVSAGKTGPGYWITFSMGKSGDFTRVGSKQVSWACKASIYMQVKSVEDVIGLFLKGSVQGTTVSLLGTQLSQFQPQQVPPLVLMMKGSWGRKTSPQQSSSLKSTASGLNGAVNF